MEIKKYCTKCNIELTNQNWFTSCRKHRMYICKNCKKEHSREYFQNNKEKYKEKNHESWQKIRNEVTKRFNNKCVRCGFDDPRAFQIDHINGGGIKERQQLKSWHYYKKLLELSEEELKSQYQLLCANCNQIKRYEIGSHNHAS